MSARDLAIVRNPVLSLPAAAGLSALSDEARVALCALLRGIATDARTKAEHCWKRHKAPMACYWKAVAVYAGHLARAIERSAP